MLEATHEFPHPHSELVDALGGPSAISNGLKKHNIDITPQAVSLWRRRGISSWVRNAVAEMLIHAGVQVPKGFTASQRRKRRTL